MSNTWAHIRADEKIALTSKVGGISLALRHARMASRVGWQGVRFLVEDESQRAALARSLERRPAPEGLEVQIQSAAEAPTDAAPVQLEGAAIYLKETLSAGSPKPEPDFRIGSKAELSGAQRFLFAQIRKSIVLDGVIAFYLMRPLARLFTRVLLPTPVSPNQATLGALACGIGAAVCAGLGGAYYAVFAGLLYWLGGVFDCIDGELARMRLQSSKIGEWLDSMVDEFSTVALVVGLGIGLARDGAGDHWMYLGFAGAAVGVLALAPMYMDLHRKKLAIDTAQFPWFFDDKSKDADDTPPGAFGKLLNFFGYFIRRDANITATAIFLILDLRALSLGLIVGAFALVAVLVITHYTVMASRNASAT
jgi:phosphatidylglycerophosphate synthase